MSIMKSDSPVPSDWLSVGVWSDIDKDFDTPGIDNALAFGLKVLLKPSF